MNSARLCGVCLPADIALTSFFASGLVLSQICRGGSPKKTALSCDDPFFQTVGRYPRRYLPRRAKQASQASVDCTGVISTICSGLLRWINGN